MITASNIRTGYLDFSRKEYISEESYNNRQMRGVTKKGDLVFTTEAPMGNIAINPLDYTSCGQRVITFQQYKNDTLDNMNFCFFVMSPAFQESLKKESTGTTAKGIKAQKLKKLLLPLPPLAEQKRIVAKVEALLAEVEGLAKTENELATLKANFPKDMKAALLQAAIEGKLTEQRKEDGDAHDLLQEIQKEKQKLIAEKKIKREKPLLPIGEDEVPFALPKNWCWVRFGNIVSINPRNQIDDDIDISFLPMRFIQDGYENRFTYEVKPWGMVKSGFTHKKWRLGICKDHTLLPK